MRNPFVHGPWRAPLRSNVILAGIFLGPATGGVATLAGMTILGLVMDPIGTLFVMPVVVLSVLVFAVVGAIVGFLPALVASLALSMAAPLFTTRRTFVAAATVAGGTSAALAVLGMKLTNPMISVGGWLTMIVLPGSVAGLVVGLVVPPAPADDPASLMH